MTETAVHDGPKRVFTMVRNTHPLRKILGRRCIIRPSSDPAPLLSLEP